MRTYLATIHKRSDKHKKRFALLSSLSFTSLIFLVWVFVSFGLPQKITQSSDKQELVALGDVKVQDKSLSIDPLKNGVAAAWQSISGTLGSAKAELEQVDFDTKTNSKYSN